MKRALLVGALAASTVAHAGSLEYDVRFDADNSQYNTAAATADTTKFYMQTGRIDYKGKVNEDLSYRLRVRFNRDANTSSKYSSLGANVDMASITHKLMDGVALTAGKFGSDIGGFEGITAGPDIYFKSQAYQDLDYATTTVTGTNTSGAVRGLNIIYQTGFKVAYTMGDHEIAVMMTNTDTDSTTTTDGQTRPLMGLVWKGKYLDKALQSMVSYHTVAPGGVPAVADKHNFMTVGLKYDAGMWFAQADYDMFQYVNSASPKDETTTSTIIEAGYKMDQWTFKAKAESSEIKFTSAETKKTFSGMGAAVEYKPFADANFRYHLAYTSRTTGQTAVNDKIESHYIAGLRLMGDFLK